jgi:hypothetical protein
MADVREVHDVGRADTWRQFGVTLRSHAADVGHREG